MSESESQLSEIAFKRHHNAHKRIYLLINAIILSIIGTETQPQTIPMDPALATPNEILHELGGRLRQQRLAQQLSQQELAAMAGVALGTVKKLESSGVSSLETVVRVVQALGLADELQPLFVLKRNSIAQMLQAAQPLRQRAPRKRAPATGSP